LDAQNLRSRKPFRFINCPKTHLQVSFDTFLNESPSHEQPVEENFICATISRCREDRIGAPTLVARTRRPEQSTAANGWIQLPENDDGVQVEADYHHATMKLQTFD